MSQTVVAPTETPSMHKLTAQDRCDRCGAQAYLMVGMGDMDLLFCAHHARAHGPALAAQGARILVDDTYKLAPTNRQQGASY